MSQHQQLKFICEKFAMANSEFDKILPNLSQENAREAKEMSKNLHDKLNEQQVNIFDI